MTTQQVEPTKPQGLLMWVGEAHYNWPHNFYDEARLIGISKRISAGSVPPADFAYPCQMYLVHPRAVIWHDRGYFNEETHPRHQEPHRPLHEILDDEKEIHETWDIFFDGFFLTIRGLLEDREVGPEVYTRLAKHHGVHFDTGPDDDVSEELVYALATRGYYISGGQRDTARLLRILSVLPAKVWESALHAHGLYFGPGIFMYGHITGVGYVAGKGEAIPHELAEKGVIRLQLCETDEEYLDIPLGQQLIKFEEDDDA